MSERRACRLIQADRKTVRYRSRRPRDDALRSRLAGAGGRAAPVRLSPAAHPSARRGLWFESQEDAAALPRGGSHCPQAQGPQASDGRAGADPRRGEAERPLVGRLHPRPALERSALPHPQRDRRRDQGKPDGGRRHLALGSQGGARTRRDHRAARQTRSDRLRSRNRVHLQRYAGLGSRQSGRLAFHCAW